MYTDTHTNTQLRKIRENRCDGVSLNLSIPKAEAGGLHSHACETHTHTLVHVHTRTCVQNAGFSLKHMDRSDYHVTSKGFSTHLPRPRILIS